MDKKKTRCSRQVVHDCRICFAIYTSLKRAYSCLWRWANVLRFALCGWCNIRPKLQYGRWHGIRHPTLYLHRQRADRTEIQSRCQNSQKILLNVQSRRRYERQHQIHHSRQTAYSQYVHNKLQLTWFFISVWSTLDCCSCRSASDTCPLMSFRVGWYARPWILPYFIENMASMARASRRPCSTRSCISWITSGLTLWLSFAVNTPTQVFTSCPLWHDAFGADT